MVQAHQLYHWVHMYKMSHCCNATPANTGMQDTVAVIVDFHCLLDDEINHILDNSVMDVTRFATRHWIFKLPHSQCMITTNSAVYRTNLSTRHMFPHHHHHHKMCVGINIGVTWIFSCWNWFLSTTTDRVVVGLTIRYCTVLVKLSFKLHMFSTFFLQ